MAQLVTALASQACQPEFDPRAHVKKKKNPTQYPPQQGAHVKTNAVHQQSGKQQQQKKTTPQSCPLTHAHT